MRTSQRAADPIKAELSRLNCRRRGEEGKTNLIRKLENVDLFH